MTDRPAPVGPDGRFWLFSGLRHLFLACRIKIGYLFPAMRENFFTALAALVLEIAEELGALVMGRPAALA